MLNRPVVFPEELDRGYLGRVMCRNGAATEKYAVELMRIWAGVADKSRLEVSCLELLSKVAGIDLPVFVRKHSTLPFRRAITSCLPEVPHGSEENRSNLWSTGMRLARTGAYFCAECVHEDMGFHGQSYWRREPQIPGMLWCSKHITPLKYSADESAFLRSPAEQLQHCQSVDETWVKESFENKAIQRYCEICFHLLDTRAPFDVNKVSEVLKAKASRLGFQTNGKNIRSPLLNDAFFDAFEPKWLATVLPELGEKTSGKLRCQTDGVLYFGRSTSSVSAYVLACSLLFETADMALNAIQSSLVSKRKTRQRFAKFTSDELLEAYIQGRGNYWKIASKYFTKMSLIAFKMAAIGLPNLCKPSAFKAAFTFYVEKQSLKVSATNGNMSLEAMKDLIRNASCDLPRALQVIHRLDEQDKGVKLAVYVRGAELLSNLT